MKKRYIILILVFSVVLAVWLFTFVMWINSWAYKLLNGSSMQENKPSEIVSETTNVFGVEMQNDCYAKYENFLKNYSADYSKCLTGFNFSEEYCGGYDPDTQALSDENVVVILDASGSMAEMIDVETKMAVAKRAVSNFLTKMPSGVNTGLIVYGHKGSNSQVDKELSCQGIEEIIKLGQNNSSNIISAINSFEPEGWTPIAGALDFAKKVFNSRNKNDKNYLILLSDGIESCDGDPIISSEDLSSGASDINLIVIGLANDRATRDSLEKIASYGGGTYVAANNFAATSNAFNKQLLLIKKDCLKTTLAKLYFGYKGVNYDNLSCWLNGYKNEADNFNTNVVAKSIENQKCNQPIADALRARQADFWGQRQELEIKQDAAYKKIETETNAQLNILDKEQMKLW